RAEGKHFFDESKKCIIEGTFKVDSYDLVGFFNEHDIDYDKETIVRRELTIDGKSRAFVNDSPVTLNVLRLLGEQLFDIHSQHATLQLNTEKFQLMVIDSIAKNDEQIAKFKDRLSAFKKSKIALERLKEEIALGNAESDFNQFQFDELVECALESDEQELLESEISQLENAEEIKRGLFSTNLIMDDDERSVNSLLKEAYNQLQATERYFPVVEPLLERLNSTLIELKDVSAEISDLERSVSTNEERLQFVNDRLSSIYRLQKKHRVDTITELLNIQDALGRKLQSVANQEEDLFALENDLKVCYENLSHEANVLHDSRLAVIDQVVDHVESVLGQVGMGNARLQIELTSLPVEKYRNDGGDDIQFLFSANKGQPLQSIHRVASGGELSRVMLAVKSLVAKSTALPSIIFDEIDTGISGEVALKVGGILDELSDNMQVMAITHLPQIASRGKSHFKVYKLDEGEKTRSNIALLNKEERVHEIAQMLSGTKPGDSALKHAKDLIGN